MYAGQLWVVCVISLSVTDVCLFVCRCKRSSSFRFTSSLSFRVWHYPWPLCPWAWLSPTCPPSPPAPASCRCPASSRLTRTWPRRTRAPATGPRATARTTQTNPTSLHRDASILCRKRGRTTPSVYSFSFTGSGLIQYLSLSFTTATLYSVWFICFSLVVFAKALLLLLLILGVSDLNKPPSLSIQLQHVTHLKSCVLLRRGVLLL